MKTMPSPQKYFFVLNNYLNKLTVDSFSDNFFFLQIGIFAKDCGQLKDAKDALDAFFKTSRMKDGKQRLPTKDPSV